MIQTPLQQLLTVGAVVLATLLTRFLPFAVFLPGRPTPRYVQFLGRHLPLAVFALLVVYCLRHVPVGCAPHGLPELMAIAATVGLHLWKRQFLVSIAGGTALYMLLVQFVFID